MGRPSQFSVDVASEICGRLASGESLRAICRDEGFPPESTVRGWVIDNVEGFSAQYARARELQLESWADEIVEISDDGTNDWMERATKGGDTETVIDHEHITRSRLRVDTRKWLLSRLVTKFSDKTAITGADGGAIATEVVYRWASPGDE